MVTGLDLPRNVEVAVCPPFVYLQMMFKALSESGIVLGAQSVSDQSEGAYTGEISALMLRDVGCRYVIVGHSERRHIYGETDTQVARRFQVAQQSGLIPILCVGEHLQERERGQTEQVVARQLDAVVNLLGAESFSSAVIAYEPVWAIGTGKTASPLQAQDVHAYIRGRIARDAAATAGQVRILYGGSVKAGNVADLFQQPDIDGGLIGGASLQAEEFLAICRAADK